MIGESNSDIGSATLLTGIAEPAIVRAAKQNKCLECMTFEVVGEYLECGVVKGKNLRQPLEGNSSNL
jgi:hypothetical protein